MSNRTTPLQGGHHSALIYSSGAFGAQSPRQKARPCRLSVEAATESEARRILAPHFILSLAARLPVREVRHA